MKKSENTDKEQLLEVLEKAKVKVENGEEFVCNIVTDIVRKDLGAGSSVGNHPVNQAALALVRRHIGYCCTVRHFLHEQWDDPHWDIHIDWDVVQSYRIAMLNNMIKMVKGEPHA